MARRSVVIVAFDGMQPLDAIGPHEVFAGATAILAAKNRANAGYDLSHGLGRTARRSRPRADCRSCTTALPARRNRIDTLLIPGGDGARAATPRRH